MRIRILSAVLFSAYLLNVSSAFAQTYSPAPSSNWYVSGSAGGYFRETQDGAETMSNGFVSAPGNLHEAFDPGFLLNAALGYKLPGNFRVEAELGYAHYQSSKVSPVSAALGLNGRDFNLASGGDNNRYIGTINGFYDIPVSRTFTPYIGAGLGGAYATTETAVFKDASGSTFTQRAGGDQAYGVVFGEVGLSIALNDKFSLVPAYRYYHFFQNANQFGDEGAHVAKVGLRYSF